MNPKLKEKIVESVSAVLPITGIVLFISVFLAPMDLGSFALFLTDAHGVVISLPVDEVAGLKKEIG